MANEFVVKNGLITPTVQLPGATSGTVTISAPAVAGTTTIALPATAGTIVTTGDTGTVTNTMLAGSIANNKLANSTISGTALGGTLPTATFNVSGTGLSGSATYNGTTASTFTVTSNATSANTVSTIVSRDASGNFSAGTITAALNGNASTASTLQTARTITLSGDVAGSVSFNGSTDVSITTTIQPNSVALGTDTTGNYVATVAVSGTGLSVSGSGVENAAVTVTSNATNANTASTIVARDASGNFSAGTITAALSGNASTASALQTARTISLTGDVTGSVSFDGSGNAAIATTIQPDSVVLGTDTTGNYMVNVAAGTGVSVSHTQGEGSTATVSIGQPVGTTDNVTFNSVTVNGTLTSDDITSTNISIAGNATITGNLTVSGTTTTVNSTAVSIADVNIELARNATTAAEANGAGLTVTGPTTAATLTYTSADDRWNFNKNLNVGTVFGALSGNASTASTWQTARTLSLAGDLSGSVSINGGANVTLTATIAANSVALGTDTTGNYVADITAGNAITVSGGGAENATITVNHADTSSVANQTAATNTFVSGITFDTYGHVQTITTGSPSGFLTAESDTLATVTGRGATTSTAVSLNGGITIGDTSNAITTADDYSSPLLIKRSSNSGKGALLFQGSDNIGTAIEHGRSNAASHWGTYLAFLVHDDNTSDVIKSLKEKLRINATGVGIGTTSPSFPLHVSRNANQVAGFESPNANTWIDLISTTRTWSMGSTGTSTWAVYDRGSNATRIEVDTSSNLFAYGSMRAPIFYDSNDTNYYTDPASTSVINALTVSTINNIKPKTDVWHQSNEGKERFYFSPNSTTYYRTGANFVFRNNSDSGIVTIDGSGNLRTTTGGDNYASHSLHVGGTGFATSDFRAPIFYDSADTSFYVDPANTGTSARFAGQIVVEDGIRARTSAFGSPYNLFALSDTYDSATYYGIKYVEGTNDTIQVIGANNVGLSIGMDTGDTTASHSLRAPIFYDSNDTTYYVDPNSTSIMKGIDVRVGSVIQFYTSAGSLRGYINATDTDDNHLQIATSGGEDIVFKDAGLSGTRNLVIRGGNTGTEAYGSMRSPIFYDSANTGYYLDPNSGTSLVVAGIVKTNADRLVLRDDSIEVHATDNDSAGVAINYYGYASGTTRFRDFNVYDGKGGLRFKTYGSANYAYSPSSFRAPIFYDSDDTGYYWDGASTSKWNESNQNGWHTFNNYGIGVTGTYDSTRLQTVFAMGSAYRMASDGSATNNMYGLAWSHPNAGSLGGANNLNDHGLLIINNGTFRAALSSRAVFSADVRGTLFYDYNDTNYYVDPNSTSRIRRTNLIASGSGWDDGLNLYSSDATNRWNFLVDDGASDSLRIAYNNSEAFNINTSRNVTVSVDIRAPIYYDSNDTGFYVDGATYSRLNQLNLSHGRLDANERFPVGHYSSGETVFEIDTMWTNTQLQAYFNSSNVSWVADSTAPGGYAIQIVGNIGVGGEYTSGFPYIPVEQDDIFYMECWIKDVSGTNGHYMGSMDYNHNLSSLGGNPGSYGYWVMSNSFPGTSWQKYSGYITGFGTSTGTFVSGTKYWTPQALFNYSGAGTSYISGWKVTKVNKRGRQIIQATGFSASSQTTYQLSIQNSTGATTLPDLTFGADGSYAYIQTWNSKHLLLNEQGNIVYSYDFRPTIIYDRNNTGYYVDPHSVSIFNDIRASSGNTQIVTGNTGQNTKWRTLSSGATDVGISFYDVNDAWRMQLYASSGNYGFLNGNWASWDIRKVPSGELYLNNQSTYYINGSEIFYNRVYGNTDIRSRIYYDYDDTAYYIDPNSTSSSALRIRGGALHGPNTTWGEYLYVGTNGSVDVNTATVAVTNGNLHIDAKNGYQIYLNNYSSSSYTVANQSIRSPIFYDFDNTSYYLDPNSTTSIRTVGSWRSDSSSWDGEFAGKIQYHSNNWYLQASGSWYFRNAAGTNVAEINNSGYILGSYFNSSAGNSENPTIGQIWTQNTSDNYLRKSTPAHFISQLGLVTTSVLDNNDRTYLTDSRGAARLPSYYDDRYAQWDFQNTSDTGAGGDTWHGLLTVAKWTVYDPSHRQEQIAFTGNDLKRRTATSDSAWGSWKTIWDSGNLTNLNQLTNGPGYITSVSFDGLTSKTGGTGTYTTTGDFRAPIFYNHTDTGYYVDPDSLSVMNRISLGYNTGENNSIGCSNWFRSSGASGWYNGSYGGGIWQQNSTWVEVYNNKQFYVQNYIQSDSSVRAPIFYDSASTSYYLDMSVNGGTLMATAASADTLGYNASYGIYIGGINGRYIYSGNSSYTGPVFWNGSAAYTVWHSGNLTNLNQLTNGPGYITSVSFDGLTSKTGGTGTYQTSGDFRAPIFYDSNDTGYYVNPNSTDYSARLAGNLYFTSYPKIGIEDAGMDCYLYITDLNPTVDGVSYGGEFYFYGDKSITSSYLNFGGAVVENILRANSSLRAPIFYDSNDTAFYVDPANPSVMEYVEGSNACSFRGANRAINDWNYTGLTTNPTVNSYDDGSWYIDAGNSGDWSRGLLSKRRFRRTVGLTLEYEIYQQDNSGTGFGTRSMVGFVNGDSTNYSYNQTPSNMTYHDNGGLFVYTNGTSSGTDYNIDARNSWYKFKTILRGSGANHYVWHNSEWRLIKSTTTNDQNSYEWLRICVSISAQRVYFRNMKVYDAEGMVLAGSAVSDYYIDRVPGRFYVATDVRSPGFYDSDNSSYYLDPSSTGTSLAVRGMITSGSTGALGGGEIQIYGSNGNLILKPSINSTAAEIASAASTGIIFKANNSSVAQISSSGIISSSNITAYGSPSDRRLKENIEPLTNSLQKVMALEGVSFNWKKDTKEHTMVGLNKDIGLIAQNVQQVLPDLVREEEDGTLSLRDRGLVAVLIEAIKEQQSEIDELKALVRQLLAK